MFSRPKASIIATSIQLALLNTYSYANETETVLMPVDVVAETVSSRYLANSMTTSTGLPLNIKETPQSVSAISKERMEDQAMQSLADVISNTTGISSKAVDSRGEDFYARGFEINSIQIDGVSMSWNGAWNAGEAKNDTAIYERIEVVRGATGLLSGAGNPSAAINLIRKHADSKVFAGELSLGLGSWNQYGGTADLSMPLNQDGSIRGRLVASYDEQDSYIDLEHAKKKTLYGVVDFDLTESTHFSVGVSQQQDQPKASMWGGLFPWYDDGSRTDWASSKTTAPNWSYWLSEQQTYFLTLEHEFSNHWKVNANISHSKNNNELKLLWLDGLPNQTTGLGLSPGPSNYDSSRTQNDFGVRASGPIELMGREHEIAFGLTHSKQNFESHGRNAEIDMVSEVGDFNLWDGSYAEPTWGASYLHEAYKTTQTGAYTVGRFALTESLKLILGGRLSNWRRTAQTANLGPAYEIEHKNIVTPYAGIVFDLNNKTSAYVSYTNIFNPQEYRDQNGNYLEPILGKSYEAGLKGDFFDGELLSSVAIFRIEQDNLAQADGSHQVAGGINEQAYYAAQGTVSQGYEIEISGEITKGWDLSLGWTHFKSKDADGVSVNTDKPNKMLKLFSKYRLPGSWSNLTVGGGVNWEGKTYAETNNPVFDTPEKLEQSSYALANLMVRYDFSENLQAQLNINNLFDKKYYSTVGFYNRVTYGARRNLMATAKYNW